MNLPKAETLILLAFLVCMSLWAISRCSESRADAVRKVREIEDGDSEERPSKQDTAQVLMAPKAPSNDLAENNASPPVSKTQEVATMPLPGGAPKRPTRSNETRSPAPESKAPVNTAAGSKLFVTIDGLKVRKEPGLKGETVAELKLYEPVTFLNKKTDWTQEISLGYEKVTDHWVKVRTQSGKEGWVFGAGVHYYKMKRQGVLDDKKSSEPPQKKQN